MVGVGLGQRLNFWLYVLFKMDLIAYASNSAAFGDEERLHMTAQSSKMGPNADTSAIFNLLADLTETYIIASIIARDPSHRHEGSSFRWRKIAAAGTELLHAHLH